MIKTNKNTHGLNIFDHEYLYTAYADDATFFLENISSIKVVLKDLQCFSSFSGLRPNFTKCEIAGIGILKSVNVALCGMKCLDLTKEYIKILGVDISYNRKVQDNKNFCDTVKNISNVIKLAHETFVTGRKDNNFQITCYLQNSLLSITNINSKLFS